MTQNWTQWLIFGPIIALIYLVIGYHIASLSRAVRKNWDMPTLDGVAMSPLKIFLYPVVVAEDIPKNRPPFWLLSERLYNQPSYVINHLFLWPFRIIGNLFLIIIFFFVVPTSAFLVSLLVVHMVIGTIKAVAGKIKAEN